jgi:Cof subfamily protein (haloacid dehalogenase superfamily)
MMIKLITSDIDGTLVPDGYNEINPELFEVILKLRAKGIQFAAASGRQWASIESIFDPVKEKIFYLSDNGAYVGCHGRNLFINTIEPETIMDMVKEVRKIEGLEVMVSGPDVVYLETKDQEFFDWLIHGYKFQAQWVEDLTKVESEFIKVSVYRKSEVEENTRMLRTMFKDRLKMTISGDMWMDCMRPGINKGQAVKLLQDSLGIKPEETMAFGDQLNDIEMLQQAYYSFAVGNAREEVKNAASFQTDLNINDGVLKILKLLL